MALRNRQETRREPLVLPPLWGWNDDQNNDVLADADLRTAENLLRYRTALPGNRPGFHRDPFGAALNSGGTITGIFDFHSARGTAQDLIVVSGDHIYRESAGADPSTATQITGATAPAAGGADEICTWAVFKDTLYLASSGLSTPQQIPASSGNAADVTGWFASGHGSPRYVFTKWGYLFFAGFTGTRDTGSSEGAFQDPMVVYHSELYDAGTWLELNNVNKVGGLSVFGDEYVTALFEHRDFLMIGTNKRIYPVSYSGDLDGRFLIQRPLNVGVAGQQSVVSINGQYTFFLDPDGDFHSIVEVAQGFGDVGEQSLSRKIRNHMSTHDRGMLHRVHGVYSPELTGILWSAAPSLGTSLTEGLWFDLTDFPLDDPDHRLAKWYRWKSRDSDFKPNVLARVTRDTDAVANASEPDNDGKGFIYFGTESGEVKRFNETISYDEDDSDAQRPVDVKGATKFFDFGHPSLDKHVAEVVWDVGPASDENGPTTYVAYDYGRSRSIGRTLDMGEPATEDLLGSTFILGTSVLGEADEIFEAVRETYTQSGRLASIEFEGAVDGTQAWRFQRITPLVEIRGVSPEQVSTNG